MKVVSLQALMDCSMPELTIDKINYSLEPLIEKDLGRIGTAVKADGEGFIETPNTTALAAAIMALGTYSLVSGRDFVVYGDNQVPVHQIIAAACIEGGPHIRFEVMEQDSSPNHRRVRFSVFGKTNNDLPLDTFRLKTVTKVDGLRVITQTGTIYGVGTDAIFSGILQQFKASYPASTWIIEYDVSYPIGGGISWQQLKSDYSIKATELANPLPDPGNATIVYGEFTQRADIDDQMRKVVNFEYDLLLNQGDYQPIIDNLRPDTSQDDIFLTHQSVQFSNVRENRLRITFTLLYGAEGNALLNYTRTLTFVKNEDTFEEFKYPGADPVAVQRPKTMTRILDSGSATGLGKFPKPPDPLVDHYEAEPTIRAVDQSKYEKVITWDYQMVDVESADGSGGKTIEDLITQIGRPDDPDFYEDGE